MKLNKTHFSSLEHNVCCILVICVFLCCSVCLFLYGPVCHGALKLTCLQHSLLEHHFNLYYKQGFEKWIKVNKLLWNLLRSFIHSIDLIVVYVRSLYLNVVDVCSAYFGSRIAFDAIRTIVTQYPQRTNDIGVETPQCALPSTNISPPYTNFV